MTYNKPYSVLYGLKLSNTSHHKYTILKFIHVLEVGMPYPEDKLIDAPISSSNAEVTLERLLEWRKREIHNIENSEDGRALSTLQQLQRSSSTLSVDQEATLTTLKKSRKDINK